MKYSKFFLENLKESVVAGDIASKVNLRALWNELPVSRIELSKCKYFVWEFTLRELIDMKIIYNITTDDDLHYFSHKIVRKNISEYRKVFKNTSVFSDLLL